MIHLTQNDQGCYIEILSKSAIRLFTHKPFYSEVLASSAVVFTSTVILSTNTVSVVSLILKLSAKTHRALIERCRTKKKTLPRALACEKIKMVSS